MGRAIQVSAHEKPIELIASHFLYQTFAKTDATRQKRYIALFEHEIAGYAFEEMRDSINKAWVLGDG